MTGPLLQVRSLSVRYKTPKGEVHALDGVDLDVDAGEIVGVVGESGCGKTTLAAAVMALLPPNARIAGGDVLLEGRSVAAMGAEDLRAMRGGRAARIPQDAGQSLHPTLTIGRQFRDAVHAHRPELRRKELWRVLHAAVNDVGLADPEGLLHSHAHQLSGGMRQRVMIAMALALRPSLLLADEPTSALDVTIEAQILELLRQLRRSHGVAIVFISHNLGAVTHLCDRVAVMYAGQIVEQGPTQTIVRNPVHPYTRALVGAVPDPGAFGRALTTIPGRPPVLLSHPHACRFSNRCPIVQPVCRTTEPELIRVGRSVGRCLALDPVSGYVGPGDAA